MFHRAVPRVIARFEWSRRRGDAARESSVILSLQNHLRVDVKLDGFGLPWFPRGAMRHLAGCMVLLPIIDSYTTMRGNCKCRAEEVRSRENDVARRFEGAVEYPAIGGGT